MIKFVNHDNRISKTTNGVKTDSVWANGGIVNDVVHENGFDVVKTYNDDNTVFSTTVLNSAHTNVSENLVSYNVVNTQGDLVQSVSYKNDGYASSDLKTFRYNAYGIKLFEKTINIETNAPVTAVDTSNPFGYRGYYTDVETGLYYLMARYYDPTTGQFTQEDTYQEDNKEYNLYGYCSANPVMYTDPSGNAKAKTLQELYPKINKESKSGDAIFVTVIGNCIVINVNLHFSKYSIDENGNRNRTKDKYKNLVKKGMKSWAGKYKMHGVTATVIVDVTVDNPGIKSNDVSIQERDNSYQYVSRPLWGWKRNKNGSMHLYTIIDGKKRPNSGFKSDVAHEFGHFLGIGDAYEVIGKHKAAPITTEVPADDIMRNGDGGTIYPNDIQMFLYAFNDNKFQEFVGKNKSWAISSY